jgi:hypothetical protein
VTMMTGPTHKMALKQPKQSRPNVDGNNRKMSLLTSLKRV